MTDDLKHDIKSENDLLIQKQGYRVNNWLPILERPKLRNLTEIKGRMAVMNALINLSFEAPVFFIKKWIKQHHLSKYLSKEEEKILNRSDEEITESESIAFRWYLESLWAMMWATDMISELKAENWCGDNMASLLPNLEQEEDDSKIEKITSLRSETDIYKMLDYYYRLHWYCVDERLNGKTAKINEGIVYERRKALEWIMDNESDWDTIEMGT